MVSTARPDEPGVISLQQGERMMQAPDSTETRMDLLLWRHAEAVDGTPDHTRELTQRGHKQAKRMAAWLTENHPKRLRVLVSPTMRTRQTASAFADDFEIVSSLGPDGNVADILAATGWPDASGAALVVGHQPALGRLAALLLSGQEADWTIKKGALWWFTNRVREHETQTVLRAVIPSDLI
ncbi:phosphohistidine phosphatase SixA [Thauera linaloolentis 47Lol = DSM 12138]|uniref:Phosphohistidine phosphatase SixA n=2 Tax=Thauera linaloolentis TaxID=76112 RepID=N6Y838_THAL4|nr:phosphohistidine phosphatase SixA [Thauera linaloolentis 47Lol = DSM 12138]